MSRRGLCVWGGDCTNGAVVRHVFVWPSGARTSEVFCPSCAAMDRSVYASGRCSYELVVEPIGGVGSESALCVEVMCHALAALGSAVRP